MKMNPLKIVLSFAVCITAYLPAAADAEVIVVVDVSNPAAVVFRSTGANAEGSFTASSFDGITLEGFLPGNNVPENIDIPPVGLEIFESADGSSTIELNRIFVGTFEGGFNTNDLTFYLAIPANPPIYSFTDRPAVFRCATVDLTPVADWLPASGFGDVLIGQPDAGQVIGQWQIVGGPMIAMTGDNNPLYNGPITPFSFPALLEIGISSPGSMLVQGGSNAISPGSTIGVEAGAVGNAMIVGADSKWTLQDDLLIGASGMGELTISQGAELDAMDVLLGSETDGAGLANVLGCDSLWNSDELIVGRAGSGQLSVSDHATLNTGELVVGDDGLGQMFASGSAQINVGNLVRIGFGPDAIGDNRLELSDAADLDIGGVIIHVGESGNGTFSMNAGATASGRSMSIGSTSGSNGVGIFDGVGTVADFEFLFNGNSGNGQMTVSGGAIVNFDTDEDFDFNLSVGRRNDSFGILTITGQGSRVFADKHAEIGGAFNATGGTGVIEIESGGVLETAAGFIGTGSSSLVDADNPGGNGTVNVSGAGSSWVATSILVGHRGQGLLNITDGGMVSTINNMRVGDTNAPNFNYGSAEIFISGAGSRLNVGTELSIGDDRAATATIADGAIVNSGINGTSEAIIGDLPTADGVLVTVDGGTWDHDGGLFKVGADGGEIMQRSTLRVIGGGLVETAGDLAIAADTTPSHGLLEVTGMDSAVTVEGDVRVGDVGTGTLLISDGGTLELNDSSLSFGEAESSTGTGLISGASAFVSAGNVFVGSQGIGTLTIENGGRLVTSSTVHIADSDGSRGVLNINSQGILETVNLKVSDGSSDGPSDSITIDGGQVFVSESLQIFEDGVVTLSDGLLQADSIVPVDQSFQFNFLGGTLSVAAYGSATTLADLDQFGGTLAPAGNLSNIGQTEIFGQYLMLSTSMAEFDIEGNGAAGTDYDQITVYGNSITEGTIRVNLNGFQPSSGDTFLLIDATGIRSGSPEFDFSNAALTGGLAWDTSNFLIDGTIGVVGESFLLGDVNCDGNVNLLDVQPFVDLIASGGFSIKADINQDGVVNLLDIGPFVAVLSGN